MAVKVVVAGGPVTQHPCIKVLTGDTLIVLFTAPGVGVVLRPSREGSLGVGHHSTYWRDADFEPLGGSVTLSNEEAA